MLVDCGFRFGIRQNCCGIANFRDFSYLGGFWQFIVLMIRPGFCLFR